MHVMHTWGHPSETFVRALVLGGTGARPVIVCAETVGPPIPGLEVRTLSSLRRRLPPALAGKAAVLVAAATGRRAGVGVVHAHFAHELLLAERTARLLRRPLVISLHGRDLLVELAQQAEALEVVQKAAAVIVPSPFLARAATDRGVGRERLAVIPSGVDLAEIPFHERPRHPDRAPLVLFLGRFVEKKGVLAAARAVTQVAAGSAIRARFVGTGDQHDELVSVLRPLGGCAEVVDGTDREVVRRSLAEADILISPSRTAVDGDAETLLVVNLEAQAAGLAVLTTDHGGIPSGLGPGAAVVVAEGDDEGLAAALGELVEHPERWAAMGRAGRAHVEANLTLTRTTERMGQLYRSVLAGGGVPPDLQPAGTPG
jgi:colanic acid/amylovoran biosynthesis glycosyltransferase